MDQNKEKYTPKSIKKLRNSMILSFLCLFVAVAIFSAQTYAYFHDTEVMQNNKITTGILDVEFFEVQGANQQTTHNADPVKFVPGKTVDKTVKIKNTGNAPVYIRIKIEKSVLDSENIIPNGWEELVICDFNLDDDTTPEIEKLWTYRDGYFYYITKLDAGSITTSLFDTLHFSNQMGNEFTNTKLQIRLICQAVQSNGNSDSPLTAWGWPADSEATN